VAAHLVSTLLEVSLLLICMHTLKNVGRTEFQGTLLPLPLLLFSFLHVEHKRSEVVRRPEAFRRRLLWLTHLQRTSVFIELSKYCSLFMAFIEDCVLQQSKT